MKKLGIAVSDFGASQLSYLVINNVNNYLKTEYKTDIIGFYENMVKYSFNPDFACMQAVELWGYDGPVIATNLNAAQDILKIPTIKHKFFYIWDLEWVDMIDKDYVLLRDIYTNPNLTLIARCEEYANTISKMWDAKISYIVEDFDINKIVGITHDS